ncbi:MAG: ATP-binding cassette domain-containing protein [Paraclostridium sp.]
MKLLLIYYIVIGVITSLLGLITPYISSKIIDTLVYSKNIHLIINICFIMLALGILSLFLGYIQSILHAKIQLKSSFKLNLDIIEHIQKSRWSYLSGVDTVYLNQRINSDSNNIVNFSLSIYTDFIKNSISILFSSILLISINKEIFFISVLLAVINIFLYNFFKNKIYKYSIDLKESQNEFFSNLNDQLENIKFIKMNSLYKWFVRRLDSSFYKCFDSAINYEKFSNFFMNLTMLTNISSQVILFIIGSIQVINGSISVGAFTIIVSYFNNIKTSISYFISVSKTYQETKVSYDRINELLAIDTEFSSSDDVIDNINNINVRDIQFKYNDKPIFEGYDVSFEKGVLYCIHGKNGAGKSTLRDLILGLYQNEFYGNIYLDNEDINNIDMMSIRKKHIGISEQEPMLLNDTIYNNLILDENIDKSTIYNMLDKLNLLEYINSNKDKLDTIIDRNKISGGEKQKISILRVLLKNPNIMIFDEPTSAMDDKSKLSLIKYLNSIKHNKIIIIISHDEDIKSEVDVLIKV